METRNAKSIVWGKKHLPYVKEKIELQKAIENLKGESAKSSTEFEKLILGGNKPLSDVEKVEKVLAALRPEAKERVFANLDAESKARLFANLDAEVEEHNRPFTSPERCVCYYSPPDPDLSFPDADWTRFSAVNLHSGNPSSILSKFENHQRLEDIAFVSLNTMVYCIGIHPDDDEKFLWIFRFDLCSPSRGWERCLGVNFSVLARPIVHGNKLYGLAADEFLEVYDPKSSSPSVKRFPFHDWPAPFEDLRLPALSDPSSNRILVFFVDLGLYAFNPEDENPHFICLDPQFDAAWWHTKAVIADGVLYIKHCGKVPIVAYDLENKEWLNVEWTSPRSPIADICKQYVDWSGFFHLGNGILCLVQSCRNIDIRGGGSFIKTLYFKFEKNPSSQSILATPGPSYQLWVNVSDTHHICFFDIKLDHIYGVTVEIPESQRFPAKSLAMGRKETRKGRKETLAWKGFRSYDLK